MNFVIFQVKISLAKFWATFGKNGLLLSSASSHTGFRYSLRGPYLRCVLRNDCSNGIKAWRKDLPLSLLRCPFSSLCTDNRMQMKNNSLKGCCFDLHPKCNAASEQWTSRQGKHHYQPSLSRETIVLIGNFWKAILAFQGYLGAKMISLAWIESGAQILEKSTLAVYSQHNKSSC